MAQKVTLDNENTALTASADAGWREAYDAALAGNLFFPYIPAAPVNFSFKEYVKGIYGLNSFSNGPMERAVKNMTLSTPGGKAVETGFGKIANNSSGYDLNNLALMKENLGAVNSLTLTVDPRPKEIRHFAYRFGSAEDMFSFLKAVTRSLISPIAVNFWEDSASRVLAPEVTSEGFTVVLVMSESVPLQEHEAKADAMAKEHGGERVEGLKNPLMMDTTFFNIISDRFGKGFAPGEIIVPLSKAAEFTRDFSGVLEKLECRGGGYFGALPNRGSAIIVPFQPQGCEGKNKEFAKELEALSGKVNAFCSFCAKPRNRLLDGVKKAASV